jgi:hypothetical protein
LNKKYFSIIFFLAKKVKNMKTVTATLFALMMSTPFALADGCNKHGEDVVMSCMAGQAWNAETQQCVDTNA